MIPKKHIWTLFFVMAVRLWSPVSASTGPHADSTDATRTVDRPPIIIGLPALDVPFNTARGFSFPSMPQSIAVTGGVTRAAHHVFSALWHPEGVGRGIKEFMNNRKQGGLWASIVMFDLISPFRGWTHEEGHRAVLSARGIPSRDDIYRNPFAEMVSVSHVKDEDLAWLKDNHPADMARLAEAGGEAQVELALGMRKADFFEGRGVRYDLVDWWVNIGSLAWYVWYCGNDEVNGVTEEETLKEDADVSKRDIVGGDFLSWVHDLFRPDESYFTGLRGRPHPSGSGVDRYIQPSELSAVELRYLRLQGRLIFLNFLSPQMFGFGRFQGTNPFNHGRFWWNAAVTHHLTPFGTATGMHFFYNQGAMNIALTFNNYFNRTGYWPGLSAELVRYPLAVGAKRLSFSASASAWLQPRDQRFASTDARPGCGFSVAASCPVSRCLEWFLECDVKTDGWVAGNVYLDKAFQARAGVVLVIR